MGHQNHCGTHGCHEEENSGHESCHCCGHHSSCGHDHEHHHQHQQDFSKQLLELADEAWMCLLKEKIKSQIESTGGKHLDELAKIVSEANHNRWKHKTEQDRGCKDFKQHISEFFNRKN